MAGLLTAPLWRPKVSILLLCAILAWPSLAVEPALRDEPYGPHERNIFDLYQADTAEPAPLIIHVHGGGFEHGDKSRAERKGQRDIREVLRRDAHFATINYRFLDHAPLQEIVYDTARAIQFLRHKSEDYRIDPDRIAIYGESAGAGSSLWVAMNDDLADPSNDDPVLRQSTRVNALGLLAPQSTYDFARWPDVVGVPDNVWLYAAVYVGPRYYGIGLHELNKPKGIEIREGLDMLAMIDAGDPPVYIRCTQPPGKIEDWNHMLHHPNHAVVLEEQLSERGIPTALVLENTPRRQRLDLFDFLFEHLAE